MADLVTLLAQAVKQAREACGRYDLELLGGAALTVREAYILSAQPFEEFMRSFLKQARTDFPAFPPIVYDRDAAGGDTNGIGVAFTTAFNPESIARFEAKHECYIGRLQPNETKYVAALFVPLVDADPFAPAVPPPGTDVFFWPQSL